MSDLMVQEDKRDTRLALSSVEQLTALATKYYKFPPRGIPMTKEQAASLAAMSWFLDADPYNDELYPTPKMGVVKGIMLYRRKAQSYAKAINDSTYSISFRAPYDGEIDYDPTKGDMAIVCELTDAKEHEAWENKYVKFFRMFYEASKDAKWADEKALARCGAEPIHIGYGVVDGRESFSGDEWVNNKKTGNKAPEMMAREARRNKRAEKLALKSAYPNLMAQLDRNDDDFDLEQVVDVVIKQVELKQLSPGNQEPGWTVGGTLAELGIPEDQITDEERADGNPVVEGEIVDREFDIADDSPELTGQDLPEVTYTPLDPPTPSPETCKFGDDVVSMIAKANLGIKDPAKIIEALNRSEFLAPAMDDKWYRMWASSYVQCRRKQMNQEASADRADQNVANAMNA